MKTSVSPQSGSSHPLISGQSASGRTPVVPQSRRRRLCPVNHAAVIAARWAIGKSQVELAQAAGVSPVTILRMEQPGYEVFPGTLRKVAMALEAAGAGPVNLVGQAE